MTARPWFPFYVADYLADTLHLSATESGAYLHLLCHQWQHGSIPAEPTMLARISKVHPPHWPRVEAVLRPFFDMTKTPGSWVQKRLAQEMTKSDELSNKRKAAAQQKHTKSEPIAEQLHTHARAGLTSTSTDVEKEIETSTRPSADSRPPAGEFDWESSDGTIFVSADQINRWAEMFPGVNVRAQLRGARREYLSGPLRSETFCTRFEKGLRTKAEKKRAKVKNVEQKITDQAALEDDYDQRQRRLATRKRLLGGAGA